MNKNTLERFYLVVGAITAWFAIVFQLYLIIVNNNLTPLNAVIRFLSFFTILTNIPVAICYSTLLFSKNSSLAVFFSKPSTRTALATYIFIVGLVYNVVLRNLWSPQGIQYVVDELLHTFDPAFFVLYWLVFVPKEGLRYKNIFYWLLYPLGYSIYTLMRRVATGWYSYPFLNASKLGYVKTLINCR